MSGKYKIAKGMCRLICGIFWIVFTPCMVNGSENAVLVKQGKAVSCIILPERPTRAAQFAALEFRYLIHLLTGTELPVAREGDVFSGLPIRIGSRDSARNPEKFSPEEYLVEITREGITLAGLDDPDYGRVDYNNPRTYPSCSYTRKATTYAVYEFLEHACGMRFYFFGDNGIFFRPRKSLSVKPMRMRSRPAMSSCRWFEISTPEGVSARDRALLEARWRKSALTQVNHNTWSIYFRYWGRATGNFYGSLPELFKEKRPEYFAQGYKGKAHLCAVAGKFPGDPDLPPQLCSSSEGPVNYFAEEALAAFHGEKVSGARFKPPHFPGMPFYYPIMEDDNKHWCLCGNCRKLFPDVPAEQRAGYIHFDWINRIAAKGRALDPELNFITGAYSNSLLYPDPAILKLEPNVAVRLCLAIDSWFHPEIYKWQHSVYKQWVTREAAKRQLSVWCYMLSPKFEAKTFYKYGNFIPMLYPWKAGKIFREFVEDGIRGYFAEIDIGTLFLEAYVINRIAFYGKQTEPDQIISEYFQNYYGKAGIFLRDFYRKLEAVTWNAASYPRETMRNFRKTSFCGGEIHTERNNLNLLNDETEKQLDSLIGQAHENAGDRISRQRVMLFSRQIWQKAKAARADFKKREAIRNMPPPAVQIPEIRETDGQISQVDFSRIPELKVQYPLSSSTPRVKGKFQICFDSRYLYFRYHESGREAFLHRKENLWLNNIELFAGHTRERPLAHLIFAPGGAAAFLQHEIEEGMPRVTSRSVKISRKNNIDESGWEVLFAVPLKTLLPDRELIPGKHFYLNVMRTCRFRNGESYSWSALNGNGAYLQSLDRMGEVRLSR